MGNCRMEEEETAGQGTLGGAVCGRWTSDHEVLAAWPTQTVLGIRMEDRV